jgi:hypothetical protein
MQSKARPSFAFLVVTYNHQDYILEHLESIKFLVQNYAANLDIDIIINDDSSIDKTRSYIDLWLQLNSNLFRHTKTIYNPKNLGTCVSVSNMLKHMVADRCKLTAGDDVYSFENIFEITQYETNVAIESGRELHLIGDQLSVDRVSDAMATGTQVIYQNDSLLFRLKHISYNSAPNIFYATECLMHPNVQSYLKLFDVTEDWPLQLAIARQFPEHKFKLIDKVLVYYRRTAGSTYIVASQRFVRDKIKIYDDLISKEESWTEKVRLANRKFCFQLKGRYIKKILNIDLYLFVAAILFNYKKYIISSKYKKINIVKHTVHYINIKNQAERVLNMQDCKLK